MDVSQLCRKVKDLISLKNKNKITIDDLKRERADLQKAKSALEKEFKKDAAKRDRELRDLSESHNNQISAINDLHAKNIVKKDAIINNYAINLQEQRRTSNLVSDKFMLNNYRYYLVLFY